jgi:hypothetical protein
MKAEPGPFKYNLYQAPLPNATRKSGIWPSYQPSLPKAFPALRCQAAGGEAGLLARLPQLTNLFKFHLNGFK